MVIPLCLLAGVLLLPTYPQVYGLRGSANGVLFTHGNEALLFISEQKDGIHKNYLG